MRLGTYVVDERVFRVVAIDMHGGLLFFFARMHHHHGPSFTIKARSEFRLHGDDGTLILTGVFNMHEDFVITEDDEDVTIIQPVHLSSEKAWPDELLVRISTVGST